MRRLITEKNTLLLSYVVLLVFCSAVLIVFQRENGNWTSKDSAIIVLTLSGIICLCSLPIAVTAAKSDRDLISLAFRYILLSLILGPLFYSVILFVTDFYDWLTDPKVIKRQAAVVSVIAALVSGAILYTFRFKYRSCYGLTETIVGLFIAGSRVRGQDQILEPEYLIAFLTAAVYLVVRGFDNIYNGLYGKDLDPIAVQYIEGLKRLRALRLLDSEDD